MSAQIHNNAPHTLRNFAEWLLDLFKQEFSLWYKIIFYHPPQTCVRYYML